MTENLNHIIESLLFVAEEPLTVDRLKSILETVDPKEIRSALQSLGEEYDARGGGFKLSEVAGGWQLRSRAQYNQWIKRMLQPPPQRLSKAALETLAIVAYNQPIIRADIEHIRGVDCGGVLRQLMERKLIRVLGRKEIPGRPLIYATTKLFLELFELKDLKDLPSPKEIEEMTATAEETADFAGTTDMEVLPGMGDGDGIEPISAYALQTESLVQYGSPEALARERQGGANPQNTLSTAEVEKASGRCSQGISSLPPRVPAGPSRIAPLKPRLFSGGGNKAPGSK